MGEFLGLLAGIGMLLLIGALFCRFLLEMGWMRRETGRMLGRVTGMTLAMGAAYWLFGALIHGTLYGGLSGEAAIRQVFCGPSVQAMFDAVKQPVSAGPAAFIFALLAHALGALLFGQYDLGAVLTAFLLTDAGACLLVSWLSEWLWERDAERTVFLLLCLPGAVFLFLPGWAPTVLPLAALAVFLLDKLWFRRGFSRRGDSSREKLCHRLVLFLSSAACDGLLCLCAFFSALVTACAALGRIG